ncbi:tetratricopeptide repeat protein [Halopseudomonas salegens]|nr:tetratricopeptide repeat protein [Halopseudomonas salegens]
MNLLARILLILLVFSCFSAASLAEETQHKGINPTNRIAYDEAVMLLDSWGGEPSVLYAAKVKLEGILRVAPDFAPAHRQLARYHILTGFIDGTRYEPSALAAAEGSLDEALRLDSESAETHVVAGNLYFLQNRLADAAAALAKAKEIGTDDPWLAIHTADVLIAQDQHAEAAVLYQSVVDSGTDNARAVSLAMDGLILYYHGLGQYQTVESIYLQQIANRPEAAWAYGNYGGFLLCTKDDAEAAIAHFRLALGLTQYDIARNGLAAALYRQSVMVEGNQRENADELIAEARSLREGTSAQVVTEFCGGGPAVVAMQNAETHSPQPE